MKNWIISIVICVVLTSMISLVLPNGKTSKIIRYVFNLIIVFTVISPVFGFIKSDFSFSFVDQKEIVISENYLDFVSGYKRQSIIEKTEKILNDNDIFSAKIDLTCGYNENFSFIIEKIDINLVDSVINAGVNHIDIIRKVKDELKETFNVSDKVINVYE